MKRGVTLLELLVVLLILLMVTAAAIPLMAPALQNRRMREAARLTSTFIAGARSRAIQTGRETGVQLQRFNGNPWAVQLAYVEYPPPYAGDTLASKLTVQSDGSNFAFDPAYDVTWVGKVRVGDLVQLNNAGTKYTIIQGNDPPGTVLDATKQTQWALRIADGTPTGAATGQLFPTPAEPWNDANGNRYFDSPSEAPHTDLDGDGVWDLHQVLPGQFSYQIFRQPVRTSDTPMQLPDGVIIDLLYSGVGVGGQWGDTAIPQVNWPIDPPVKFDPIVTFTPNGAVGHVSLAASLVRPTGTIYLLLGYRDLMPDVRSGDDLNLHDPRPPATRENQYLQNFWISVGYQTGLIATSEQSTNSGDVTTARRIAQNAQSIGGQ